MPESDRRSAQRKESVLLLENGIWHDRNNKTSSAVQIPRLKGSHECSSANSVSFLSFRCGFTLKVFLCLCSSMRYFWINGSIPKDIKITPQHSKTPDCESQLSPRGHSEPTPCNAFVRVFPRLPLTSKTSFLPDFAVGLGM